RTWALRYTSLAEAWDACEEVTWMEWAWDKLQRAPRTKRYFWAIVDNANYKKINSAFDLSADTVRQLVGNPFNDDIIREALRNPKKEATVRTAPRECFWHGTKLNWEEERDSQIIGSMPRCRICLEREGLAA